MNVVFLGSSKFVIPILEVLRKNFDLKLVLTTEKNSTDSVPSFCIQHKIPYQSVKQFNNLTIQQLQKTKSPVAVLADFGLIIPKDILNAFPKGIINIHPSLLPKYRGPTPVQTAILNGEKTTGVSIMRLDEKIDHGPILGKAQEEILETDTAETLYKRLFEKGANLLPKILDEYLKDNLKPLPQDHEQGTFTKTLTRQSGFINSETINHQLSAINLNRMIRAYYPWPGVWTKLEVRSEKLKVRIKFLPDKKIQVEGKKPMSYKDFINGYPEISRLLTTLINKN